MATQNVRNIVPCLLWVKQGIAKQKPDRVSLDKEELKRIIAKTQSQLDDNEANGDAGDENRDQEDLDANDDTQKEDAAFAAAMQKVTSMAATIKDKKLAPNKKDGKRKHGGEDADDIVNKYGLEDYDDDESSMEFLHGIGGLTPFASNLDDPYVTLKDDVDSDDEDFVLKSSDNLIALGRVTDEAAVLEVHIYNEDLNSMFIHHDYILPTFPLVLEWLDYDIGDTEKGNFVAMGTMEPAISIWDLDVVDSLEPVAMLDGSKSAKKKKKMKKKEDLTSGHSDAVLDLSWNTNVRNVLASASADKTVCLWDLAECKAVSTLRHHLQQVQCVSWHPVEPQCLLTGSFDNSVAVVDCRSPEDNVKTWSLNGEIERAVWNHFSPFQLLASTDKGMLYCVDIRQEKPVYTLSAHEQAVTGLSLSSQIPGLLVTSSPDKHLKIWDIQDCTKPSLVLSRNLRMDILHCVSCNPDHPFVFAVGANKDFKVWDIRESAAVRHHFLKRMPNALAAECEGDDTDLPEDVAAEAMANLNMEDEQDVAEEAEMLSGDRGNAGNKTSRMGDGQGKKKKKKKKRKNKE